MKNKIYILLAVLLGFSVVGWMVYKDFDQLDFSVIQLDRWQLWLSFALALLFFVSQNFFMTCRYKFLTRDLLNWRQVFRVNVLCEFTSAVTPSSVGGSGLIFLYLYKEGVSAGKSTAVMIASLFLDELFLCVSCALLALLFPVDELFGGGWWLTSSVKWIYAIVVAVVALWTLFLYLALFCKPDWVRSVLLTVFSLPLLRRVKERVRKLSDDLVTSSHEMSRLGLAYWLKALGITALSWCSRYAVAVALLLAFTTRGNLWLAYARQWVLWMISLVSPTPGGSGVSEFMFKVYYADFFSAGDVATTLLVIVLWRLITYYSYLVVGISIVPRWLKGIRSAFSGQRDQE